MARLSPAADGVALSAPTGRSFSCENEGMTLHPALRSLILEHGKLHPHTLACLLKWHWDIDTTGAEVKRVLSRR